MAVLAASALRAHSSATARRPSQSSEPVPQEKAVNQDKEPEPTELGKGESDEEAEDAPMNCSIHSFRVVMP